METRKFILPAVAAALSMLCITSHTASAQETLAKWPDQNRSTTLLLHPRSSEITDIRHSSSDGSIIFYDETCLSNHDTRLTLYQNNRQRLILEYFPLPIVDLPSGQKTVETCPSVDSLKNSVAFDSGGQFQFVTEKGNLSVVVGNKPRADFNTATVMPSAIGTSVLHARIYLTADGKFQTEDVRRKDHSYEKLAYVTADGGYESYFLFEDGQTSRHRLTDKFGTVQAEEVYAEGGKPISVLAKTKTSVINSKFDSERHLLLWRDELRLDSESSTREAFYPGTTKLRFRAKYNAHSTSADFFREDGTVERKESMNPMVLTMTYMDKTGLIPLYSQMWQFDNKNGKAVNLILMSMSELNPQGDEIRQFKVDPDHKYIKTESRRKVTQGAITFPTVYYNYRPDATLESVQYVLPGLQKDPPPENHAAAENIKLVVDNEELKHKPFDDLPIPYPDYHGGQH